MKILMVCLGNICRSPLAEGILRSKINPKHLVDSAGTIAMHEGNQPDERSIAVAKKHGIDISTQKAQYLTPSLLEKFDLVFCMDLKNLQDVRSMAKDENERGKIFLLLEKAGFSTESEVPDPYYGSSKDFENVYQMLDTACDDIAEQFELK